MTLIFPSRSRSEGGNAFPLSIKKVAFSCSYILQRPRGEMEERERREGEEDVMGKHKKVNEVRG